MGKVHEEIDDRLRAFIEAQQVFFVATAPRADDGHVNVSAKGLADTFRVIDDHTVAYLDLTASGAETIAHVRENGRICLMWCSFERRARVVRVHGRGRVVLPGEPEYDEVVALHPPHPSTRAAVLVDVERVSDSCGFGVPVMELVEERDLLRPSAENRGPDGLSEYRATRNAVSLDGLPGMPHAGEPTDA